MDKGDQAHQWAREIYDLSERCLMAHSIRAVERYIEETLDNALYRQPHRIKVIEAKPLMYFRKRAIAFIHVGWSDILVDSEANIGFEQQRLAIAHELAHILFAKCKHGTNRIVRDVETESACAIFEKELCRLHSNFYKDERNVKRLIFHSLDGEE